MPFSRVDKHRQDKPGDPCRDSGQYSRCLLLAGKRDWKSWTCQRCGRYPGGACLGRGEEPDLSPIWALEEPPPQINSFDDLLDHIAAVRRYAGLASMARK